VEWRGVAPGCRPALGEGAPVSFSAAVQGLSCQYSTSRRKVEVTQRPSTSMRSRA